MTDIVSPEKRSANMAAIKAQNTKPEMFIRKSLHHHGFRYALHPTNVPGKPDIFLRKYNTAIFVNGCFWHRHNGCKYAYVPKSNCDFWDKKFKNNIARDITVKTELADRHIKMLVIWECTIKDMLKNTDVEEKVIDDIIGFLKSDLSYREL